MADTTLIDDTTGTFHLTSHQPRMGLMIAWSKAEPERIGEILLSPNTAPSALGRGAEGDGAPRMTAWRLRPGEQRLQPPLADPRISRRQLLVNVVGGRRLRLVSAGRRRLLVRGAPAQEVTLSPGECAEIEGRLLLLCVSLPPQFAVGDPPTHPFARPDERGLVGESPETWALRGRLTRFASVSEHALIQGHSGSGKELAARALCGGGAFVSRNAATLPEGLVDAELFGNLRDYPNPGTPERPGLIGAASGGALFLDEIGELSEALQARLLRVLDDGEYQRLGEARTRTASFRLIAATNRPDSVLKEDVLARLPLRLSIPGLSERRGDIPLLAAHLLRVNAAKNPSLHRFFPGGDLDGWPRIDLRLMDTLIARDYTTNARELWRLLLDGALQSDGDWIAPPATAQAAAEAPADWRLWVGRPHAELPAAVIQACLDEHNGRLDHTSEALGLNNRHTLSRLIKRHGLVVKRQA